MFVFLRSDWLATAQKISALVAYVNKIGQVWEFELTASISLGYWAWNLKILKCISARVSDTFIYFFSLSSLHHNASKF